MPSVNIEPEEPNVQVNIEQSTTEISMTTETKETRTHRIERDESANSSFSAQEEGIGIDLPGYSKAQHGSKSGSKGKNYDQVDSVGGGNYFDQSQLSSQTAALMRERNFLEQRTIEWYRHYLNN